MDMKGNLLMQVALFCWYADLRTGAPISVASWWMLPGSELTLAASATTVISAPVLMLRAVMSERIGERHASACRYEDEVPEGSRHSARWTHFCRREVYSQGWPWELNFIDCWQASRDGVILPTM